MASKFEIIFTTNVKSLNKDLDKVNTKIVDLKKGTQKASNVNEKYDKSVDKVEKSLKKTGKATAGLSNKNKFLSNTTEELSDKMKSLTKIGLIGLAVGLLRAGKAFLNFNKNIEKSLKLVSDLTGLTGKSLRSLTADITATANTFDKEFNEVLISANAVASTFGITVDEALTHIDEGFIRGSDSSGEFLDILKEYPAQLKMIGLNADQSFKIINQTVKQGVYSDKGIDALKEAGLKLREMPKATQDALDKIGLSSSEIQNHLKKGTKSVFDVIQMVSTKLSTLPPQSAKVGTAIADVFGGAGEDAGLEFLTTLKDINVVQAGYTEKLSKSQVIAQQNLETQRRWNGLLDSLFGESSAGFNQFIADATRLGIALAENIIGNVKKLITFFEDLHDQSMGFRAIMESVIFVFKALVINIKAGIKQVVDGFANMGTVLKGVFTLDTDMIAQGFTKLAEDFKANFADQVAATVAEMHGSIDAISTESADLIKDRQVERQASLVANAQTTLDQIEAITFKSLAKIDAKNKSFDIKKQKLLKLRVAEEKKAISDVQATRIADGIAQIDFRRNVGGQLLKLAVKETIGALVPSIIRSIPFPFNVVVAGTAPVIANSLLPEFAAGGVYEGEGIVAGSQFTGDNINARLDSGEMVINRVDQSKLFNSIKSGNIGTTDNTDIINELRALRVEFANQEKDIVVENQLNITPENLLEVNEQGERDLARREI